MKSKLARLFREWASVLDPQTQPTDAITICTGVDPRYAAKTAELVKEAVRRCLADNVIYDTRGNRHLRSL